MDLALVECLINVIFSILSLVFISVAINSAFLTGKIRHKYHKLFNSNKFNEQDIKSLVLKEKSFFKQRLIFFKASACLFVLLFISRSVVYLLGVIELLMEGIDKSIILLGIRKFTYWNLITIIFSILSVALYYIFATIYEKRLLYIEKHKYTVHNASQPEN